MKTKNYIVHICTVLKQTLAYFLAFSFIVSALTTANICLTDTEIDAHAANVTCPYTGTYTVGSVYTNKSYGNTSFGTSSSNAKPIVVSASYNNFLGTDTPVVGQTCEVSTLPTLKAKSIAFYKGSCSLCGTNVTNYLFNPDAVDGYYLIYAYREYNSTTKIYTITITQVQTLKEYVLAQNSSYKYNDGKIASHTYSNSHSCKTTCKERLHYHQNTFDTTEHTYTCDNTTTNYYQSESTETASESWCGHSSSRIYKEYFCKKCGYNIYDYSSDGCSKTSCENYKGDYTETKYYKGASESDLTHTYQHTGERFLCSKTSYYQDNYWKEGTKVLYYDAVCYYCGVNMFSYDKDTEYGHTSSFSAASHWYYVNPPASTSCYTFGDVHTASSIKTETDSVTQECDGHKYTDKDWYYSCSTCGLDLYNKYTYGCNKCDDRYTDYIFYLNQGSGILIGRMEFEDDEGEIVVNDKAYHRDRTLVCTTAEYGNNICDKVVTTLVPVNAKQTLKAGETIDTTAYAKFLNNTISTVSCSISNYNPDKYNQWQTVTLSYGSFSAVDNKNPRTTTIQVYVERTDFDLTVKLESGIKGSVTGTGTYTSGVNVSVGATTIPASGGYTFDGWHDGTSIVSTNLTYTFKMPTKNLTLTAMFTPISYKLDVKSEYTSMGTVTATVNSKTVTTAPYTSSVTVKATPKTGFSFQGWYDGTELVSSSATYTFEMPAHDVSLMAKFNSKQYTVTFDSNGGSACSSIKVTYLGTYGTLPTPTKPGYVFMGWKYNNEMITATSPVSAQSDHKLVAQWEAAVPEFILITYGDLYGNNSWSIEESNIGALGLTKYNLGNALPIPSKKGYSFVSWFIKEDPNTGFVEDITDTTYMVKESDVMDKTETHSLYAGWKPNTYTLSFNSNGGTAYSSMSITYDRKYGYHQDLPVPTKDGYTFAGWYVSNVDGNGAGDHITDDTRVQTTSNQTLYAKWSWDAVKVDVVFDPRTKDQAGLTAEESRLAGYGSTIGTLKSGSTRTVTYPGTYGGHNITACYCKESKHSSLKNFGGKHYVIDLTSTYTALPTPTRVGYTFTGWKYNGNSITATTELNVAFGHIVYATYTPKTYTITLDGQNATTQSQKNVTVTFDAKCPDVTIPTRTAYLFKGYYSEPNGAGIMYYDENGKSSVVWSERELNENITKLYAFWKLNVCDVTLDDRGATSTNHTKTTKINYGEKGPNIVVPTKTGYTFQGYYTKTKGAGTQYYNASGVCITTLPLEENPTGKLTLYAYWKPNPATPPTEDDYNEPTEDPEITVEGNVYREDGEALLYADDYNSATGALTDLQPYLTYDTPNSDGLIPGTEYLSFRAKVGSWMLNYHFHKNTGTEYVTYIVTVPYTIQYETADEKLVIQEKTGEYTFTVPKTWSYWEVLESGMYYPDSITITSDILKEQTITIPVDKEISDAVVAPEYTVKKYGSSKNHIKWPEYDSNGNAVVRITAEEQYIISYEVNTPPNVTNHLTVVCKNAAWADDTEAEVRNDRYEFGGVVLLSDEWTSKDADELDKTKLPASAEAIALTSYTQSYKSNIEMDESKPNYIYDVSAEITYIGDSANVGTAADETTKRVILENINDLNVHTPIACDAVVVDGIEDGVIVLDDVLNFFTLRVDNTGTHRLVLGYGAKDFQFAISGKSNVATTVDEKGNTVYLNQAQFPFDVYVDMGNNSLMSDGSYSTSGDYYIKAGTWLTVSDQDKKFYIPASQTEGEYEINFRTIAVNCPVVEYNTYPYELIRKSVNIDPEGYVTTDTISVKLVLALKDFSIINTNDPTAKTSLSSGNQALILKRGYKFAYKLTTFGSFINNDCETRIVPTYYWISKDGRERIEADIYYTEIVNGNRQVLIQAGSETDSVNTHKVKNNSEFLAISKSLLTKTKELTGLSSFVGTSIDMYTFGKITLNEYVKMLVGVDATTLPTRYCQTCHVVYCNEGISTCGHGLKNTPLHDVTEKLTQEWYGEFAIPMDAYVVPKDTMSGYCSACNITRYVTGGSSTGSCGHTLTDMKAFDLYEYAKINTFSGEEAFFKKDGYLAVSFEIQVKSDNGTWYTFTNWNQTKLYEDFSSQPRYVQGDVVWYDLSKSSGDDYEVGGVE